VPQSAVEERLRVRSVYLDAVRDWASKGAASPYALDAKAVLARLAVPDASIAEAHANFRLGQALLREGRSEQAAVVFAEATRLHPDSWAMWRQTADKDPRGLAVGDAFWRRVDELVDRPYYAPVDLGRSDPEDA